MTYKTLEGLLQPDGKVLLPRGDLPDHPVRVLVTIVGDNPEELLAEPGDYLERLTDYEERLAG